MPSEKELSDYFEHLPGIYKVILESFPHAEPTRHAGYGLAVPTIEADLRNRGKPYSLGEIFKAAEQLEKHGIVELKHRMFVYPTEYGEKLIAVGTGHESTPVFVEPLPEPPQ